MRYPKLFLIDRDGVLVYSSYDPTSNFYYLIKPENLILKVGVKEAIRIIQCHNIPIILVTKQRCISKGFVSLRDIDRSNQILSANLNIVFKQIYVEESAEDKTLLYKQIIEDWKDLVKPNEMVLFDDSAREIRIAQNLGIPAYDGSNLLEAVKTILHIS